MATPVTIPAVYTTAVGVSRRFDQLAQLIANPPDDRPLAGALGRAGQAYCNWFGTVQDGVQALGGPGRAQSGLLCQPYFNASGFDSPTAGPPPFLGGQCEGAYFVELQSRGPDTGFTFVNSFNLDGPIQSITRAQTGQFQFTFTGIGANGEPVSVPVNILAGGDARFLDPTPIGGFQDNCGDLPGEVEPGANPPPVPAPFPPGQAPGLDPATGQPVFFVPDVESPDPGAPDIPVGDPLDEGGGGEPTPPQPAGDGIPGEADAVGAEAGESVGGEPGEDVDFGEPPPNKVWVGCLIQSSVDSRLGNIPGTDQGNEVYPLTIGNCSLKFSTGRGESKQIRSEWSELVRPVTSLAVMGAFVQSRPGVSCKVFPISATTCKEPQCGDI